VAEIEEIEIDVLPPPVKLRPATSPSNDIVVVPVAGPPGPQGPAGPPGSGSADPYVHNQSSPAATWVINHGLGRIPQTTLVNNDDEVIIADLIHTSVNVLTVVFASPQAGTAYLI